MMIMNPSEIFQAVLIGTGVGDSLGLPREGLSRRRSRKMWGSAPLRHRLFFGRGMISDDTEHTCMAAQALIVSGGEPRRYARSLSWRLRWWLVGLPAGVGSATLRSIIKLWIGFPPAHSGVFSAGNGPAMRAAILGVYSAVAKGDEKSLRDLVRSSTRLTHTDPKAEQGALAVAIAARLAAENENSSPTATEMLDAIVSRIESPELLKRLLVARDHLLRQSSCEVFADELGLQRGVSGYVLHTVPVAIYCWLRWPGDFRSALESAILLGGDTDSVGAIVGALAAISVGTPEIPTEWRNGIIEWPRSTAWMDRLGQRLAVSISNPNRENTRALGLFWPGIGVRNLVFLAVVVLHAVRRLLPPY
jgi:ADP-ribosylglycohydrolase